MNGRYGMPRNGCMTCVISREGSVPARLRAMLHQESRAPIRTGTRRIEANPEPVPGGDGRGVGPREKE